uniref:Uncharacterized protein n=1 Tax=Oryza punctata TaxID=4537 RepID=A0A0E0MN50_ORYPU
MARDEAARQLAQHELKVSKAELALKMEEKGQLAEELAAVREVLKAREAELEAFCSETNRAKFVLSELNTRAHVTVQTLVCAFASIGVQSLTAPVEETAIGEKLKWVEKGGGFVIKATSAKGCSHIGPSARAEPSEVMALSGAGSGLNSPWRDVDDFTGKVSLALGHEAAMVAMSSAANGKRKETPKFLL